MGVYVVVDAFWIVLVLLLSSLNIDSVNGTFISHSGDITSDNAGEGPIKGINDKSVSLSDFKQHPESKSYTVTLKSGEIVTQTKLHQYYKGVQIFGASVTAQYKSSDIAQTDPFVFFGNYMSPLTLEKHLPTIKTDLDCATIGAGIVGKDLQKSKFEIKQCDQYIYLNATTQKLYNTFFVEAGSHGVGKGIMPNGPTAPGVFYFQFIIDINSRNPSIIEKINLLQYALIGDHVGNPNTGFSDASAVSSLDNKLEDSDNRATVRNCNEGTSCSAFSCDGTSSSTWPIDCEFDGCASCLGTVNEGQGIALLAYMFTLHTYECFDAIFETLPFGPVPVKVHYSPYSNSGYDNAFWDGSSITFGDGENAFYPLVCMDVVAHEIAHGFTSRNSNLQYSGQSGGMNEAYSDLAGKSCEAFSKNSATVLNWEIGKDIFKSGGALRYMNDPPRDGQSIDHIDDYYNGLDVHYSSGCYNKAFYNMVQNGMSIEQVFKTVTRANALFWTQTSTMEAGAQGVLNAADSLSLPDTEKSKIRNAFQDVGLLVQVDTGILFTESSLSERTRKTIKREFDLISSSGLSALIIKTIGNNGDADLYVKHGSNPNKNNGDYDCRSWSASSNEECRFTSPQTGTYYIHIYAYGAFSGLTLQISSETPAPLTLADTPPQPMWYFDGKDAAGIRLIGVMVIIFGFVCCTYVCKCALCDEKYLKYKQCQVVDEVPNGNIYIDRDEDKQLIKVDNNGI